MILGICSVLLRALPKISPKPLLRGWGVRRSGLEGPWEGAGEDVGRAGGSASPGAYAVCLTDVWVAWLAEPRGRTTGRGRTLSAEN